MTEKEMADLRTLAADLRTLAADLLRKNAVLQEQNLVLREALTKVADQLLPEFKALAEEVDCILDESPVPFGRATEARARRAERRRASAVAYLAQGPSAKQTGIRMALDERSAEPFSVDTVRRWRRQGKADRTA